MVKYIFILNCNCMPFPTGVLFYEHIKNENHYCLLFISKNQGNTGKKRRSDKKTKKYQHPNSANSLKKQNFTSH